MTIVRPTSLRRRQEGAGAAVMESGLHGVTRAKRWAEGDDGASVEGLAVVGEVDNACSDLGSGGVA